MIDEHSLDELVEVLSFLNEKPTAAEILALVHGVKVTTAKSLRKGMEQVDEQSFEKEFWTPEIMAVSMPEKPDEGFRDSIDFFKKKMRVN